MPANHHDALAYDALLASIYQDLACRPIKTGWLHQLARFFQLDSAVVILENTPSRHIRFISGVGAAQASIEDPASARAQALWLLDPAHHLPCRRAVAFNRNVFRREHRLRDFFLRALQPLGLSSMLCLDIDTASDHRVCIRLARSNDREDFSATDLQLLESLSQHLRRALALAARSDSAALHPLLDQLRLGVALFDGERRATAINASGRAALNRIPGIAADADGWHCFDRRRAGTFIGYLDTAFAAARDGTPCPPLMLSLPGAPLQIVAKALRPLHAPDAARLALFMNPDDSAAEPALLGELFGFSRAEAPVAALLAAGFNIDAAAQQLGKSRNTVRAHARAIYAKAGVDNQAQLAALVMSSAANLLAYAAGTPRSRAAPNVQIPWSRGQRHGGQR